jgi:hypothetical protein
MQSGCCGVHVRAGLLAVLYFFVTPAVRQTSFAWAVRSEGCQAPWSGGGAAEAAC